MIADDTKEAIVDRLPFSREALDAVEGDFSVPPERISDLADELDDVSADDLDEGEFELLAPPVGAGLSVVGLTADQTFINDGGPGDVSGKRNGPYDGLGPLLTLGAAGVERLDHVFVSHLHTDHYGGLTPVLEAFHASDEREVGTVHVSDAQLQLAEDFGPQKEVERFFETVAELDEEPDEGLVDHLRNDTGPILDIRHGTENEEPVVLDADGGVKARVADGFVPDFDTGLVSDQNKWKDMMSMVVEVDSESTGRTALLPGDGFGRGFRSNLARSDIRTADSDLVVVPKHGGRDRPFEQFDLDAEAMLIGNAATYHKHRAPHPYAEALAAIATETDSELYATGVDRFLRAQLDESGVEVRRSEGHEHEPDPVALAHRIAGVDAEEMERQVIDQRAPADVLVQAEDAIRAGLRDEGVTVDDALTEPTDKSGLAVKSHIPKKLADGRGESAEEVATAVASVVDLDAYDDLGSVAVDDQGNVFISVSDQYREQEREALREEAGVVGEETVDAQEPSSAGVDASVN